MDKGLDIFPKKIYKWPKSTLKDFNITSHSVQFSSVQPLSCVRLFANP